VVYRSNGPQSGSIGAIVGQYKSIVTKRAKQVLPDLGTQIWQRNYYDHIILNENEWEKINAYIENNTIKYYGKY
jgi:REP element-mobilizing transposase RayT